MQGSFDAFALEGEGANLIWVIAQCLETDGAGHLGSLFESRLYRACRVDHSMEFRVSVGGSSKKLKRDYSLNRKVLWLDSSFPLPIRLEES